MVLGKLPIPGFPSKLDYSWAIAFCACSMFGWGCFEVVFFSRLLCLLFLPLSERRPGIGLNTVSKGR